MRKFNLNLKTMRQYNVIAVLHSKNPKICNFFKMNVAAIQFNPNKGFNCIRVIYKDGGSTVLKGYHVGKTWRYQTTKSEFGEVKCGDHAIITTNQGTIVLDLKRDSVKVV